MPANNQIGGYIAKCEGTTRERLLLIYEVISEIMPEAEQKVSWGMPTFKIGKCNAFHFAAFKNHVSIFPSSYAIEHFADALADYKTSKGTTQFQNDHPLPLDLIRDIATWRKQFMVDNPEKG